MPTPTSVLSPELKSALDQLKAGIADAPSKSTIAKIQQQLDALDLKMQGNRFAGGVGSGVTLETMLKENDDVSRLLRDKRGKCFVKFEGPEQMAALYRKSIVTGTATGSAGGDPLLPVGIATTGVLGIERVPGVTLEARQKLKVEDVLSSAPTSMAAVDYIKINTPMSVASPVVEASVKPENTLGFESLSEKVKLVAHWLPATKGVLDDLPSLMAIIQGSLLYYLDLEVELQILSGDGTGENLNGLLHQATAFNSSLLSPSDGWTRIDVLAQAINQINSAKELDPNFVVLNTQDYWNLRLTKNSLGNYIMGSPNLPGDPTIFGLNLVYTTSIAKGTFLVGSSNPAAASVRNRMEAVVEISDSHASFFTSNLLAIRAERRLALLTMRGGSFVTGTFSTSPA